LSDLMNSRQQAAVTIALYRFEESLRDALRWLDGCQEGEILYRRQLILGEEDRLAARERITWALVEVASLASALDLQPEQENAARMLAARMNLHWEELSDTLSRKMNRYGRVNPCLSAQLDPAVERLARLADELAEIFTRGPDRQAK
jgi:hypothetical protein